MNVTLDAKSGMSLEVSLRAFRSAHYKAACAAATRATGTRNGEQLT